VVGALLCSLAGGLALWLKGPLPVVTVGYALPHSAPFTYMVSAFPFFGVLLAEWLETRSTVLLRQIAALGLLAVARLVFLIPVSGHVLLFVFFVMWAARRRSQPLYAVEMWVCILVLAASLYTKVALWHDIVTPSFGAALGIIISEFEGAAALNPTTPADSQRRRR